MIVVEEISKDFKVAKRQSGFKNAMRAFVAREYETIRALNNVSFT